MAIKPHFKTNIKRENILNYAAYEPFNFHQVALKAESRCTTAGQFSEQKLSALLQ